MKNIERLKMETQGISYPDEQLEVYLAEEGLNANDEYVPSSRANNKAIYSVSLNILQSLANNPSLMKDYKMDDQTVSGFHENLMNRIDQLESKVRMMSTYDDSTINNVFMLFS